MAKQPIHTIYICEKCRRTSSKRSNIETPMDLVGEVWRAIPGYADLYEASSAGRIRSLDRVTTRTDGTRRRFPGKVLSLKATEKAYYQVSLCREGVAKRLLVHRLVCETFHGAGDPGMEVAHCDGNRLNNRADNLRWATSKENYDDKVAHGTARRGERSPVAKLSWEDVDEIRRSKFLNHREAGELFGVARETVRHIRAGRAWVER